MKQGVILILLIATVATVGYALYRYNQVRVNSIIDATYASLRPTQTATRTPDTTPTPHATITPTSTSIVIVMPTTRSGPSRLPNTGVADASTVWLDAPTTALLAGLFITTTTLIWLGRNQ